MKLGPDIAAVITGGASGLGEATARRLAGQGVKVALFDLNEERGESVAAELGGIYCSVDVASALSIDAGFTKARAVIGQERILINCAGVGSGKARIASRDRESGEISEHSLESFARIIQVNLIGTFCCITKSAAGMLTLDPLADGDRGVIVNTASVAAEDGQIGQVGYSASKAGVVGMTLPIARDLAREAIRINTILPGLFSTPMFARASEEFKAKLCATVPFPSRLGMAEEFAQLAETMITCGYFNGEDVRLDGGIRMPPR